MTNQDKNNIELVGEITGNPKVIVGMSPKFGRGLFATEDISKGEVIAEFDGEIYTAKRANELPNDRLYLFKITLFSFLILNIGGENMVC